MIEVPVNVPGATYPVKVGSNLLGSLGSLVSRHCEASLYVIISDTTVSRLYGDLVSRGLGEQGKCLQFDFAAGEGSKNRETWIALTDQMIQESVGRDAAIIALGGGVVGDLAGFVAATYHRGIPYVQVPTTLLAMVDSSVGGKTGVDTGAGKNLVGSFHQPRLVVADTSTLETLPYNHLRAGIAEAIKHGAIADGDYFDDLSANRTQLLQRDHGALAQLVTRSVEIKASVVSADERERGLRAILNFGHTIGHGIETASKFSLLHGEAVAIGMVVEARIGERLGVTRPGTEAQISEILSDFGLPTRVPTDYDSESIVDAVRKDKKNRAGSLRFSPIECVGQAARTKPDNWTFELPEHLLVETLLADYVS